LNTAPTPTEPKQMAKGTMMIEDVVELSKMLRQIAEFGNICPSERHWLEKAADHLSTPAPADASGWHSGMFTEEWLALPPDRKIDTMFAHGLLGYGELEPHFKIICEQIRALSTPPRPIDMGEIEHD